MCVVLLHVYGCLNVMLYLHYCLCLDKCDCCVFTCVWLFECNIVSASVRVF